MKIFEKAGVLMNQIEVVFSGAGHDPHHIVAVEGSEYGRNARHQQRRFSQPVSVELIALGAEPLDLPWGNTLLLGQMPGSPALDQKEFFVLFLSESNVD